MSDAAPLLTSPLGAAVAALARALGTLHVPGMIIGGIAVIAHGEARLTRDVDATSPAAPSQSTN